MYSLRAEALDQLHSGNALGLRRALEAADLIDHAEVRRGRLQTLLGGKRFVPTLLDGAHVISRVYRLAMIALRALLGRASRRQ
jgi:hypothetical protein